MNYRKLTFFWMLLICTIFLLACEESTTDPPINDNSPSDWTLDQIGSGTYPYMKNIWGSISNDVYTVGIKNELANQTEGWIWHYDGESWTELELPYKVTDVADVYGSSANDVWFVGSTLKGHSLILHYDGNGGWTDYSTDGTSRLNSISGISSNNIWACGEYAGILHYDGNSWVRIPFLETNISYRFSSIECMNDSNIYMTGSRTNYTLPDECYLFFYNGSSWSKSDTIKSDYYSGDINYGSKLANINNTLYIADPNVYQKTGNELKQLVDDFKIRAVGGSSYDNIFAVGDYGYTYHFNGIEWSMITTGPYNSNMYGVWTDGSEVFIIGNDFNESFIVHGR